MHTPDPAWDLPTPPAGDDPEFHPADIVLRDRLAARGITLRIPRGDDTWELPEPIEVAGGLSASEILIRWRHATP